MREEAATVVEPPRPKSPPRYPDLFGRRRLQLEVQILNREIDFLKDELQSLEGVQPVSRSCKEVNEFVGTKQDPLIPVKKKRHRSCRLFWWIRPKLCVCMSWFCCCCRCLPKCKRPICFHCSCCSCSDESCCKPSCNSCNKPCCGAECCSCCHVSCCQPDCSSCSPKCSSCWNPSCCKPTCKQCFNCQSSCCKGPPSCCKCQSSCCEGQEGSRSCCCKECFSVPKHSCPGCSCGCVWSCRNCKGCRSPGCHNPCCVTGCLC